MDIIARQVEGLISGRIIELERMGSGFKGAVDDIIGEESALFLQVDSGAMVAEQSQNAGIMDFHPQAVQKLPCFGDDFPNQFLIQKSDSWSHHNLL